MGCLHALSARLQLVDDATSDDRHGFFVGRATCRGRARLYFMSECERAGVGIHTEGRACLRLARKRVPRGHLTLDRYVHRFLRCEERRSRRCEGSAGVSFLDAALPLPPAPWWSMAGDAKGPATASGSKTVGSTSEGGSPSDDELDLDALYVSSYHDMVRLARQMVDDIESAQDVVHDAFLGLHRNRASLESPANARAYLRTAVLNHARSALRRRRTAREYAATAEPEAGPGSDEPVLLADEHAQVLSHLDSLPTRMREVLVLRYWEGLSEAEIAATLGISQGTVKSQASRAMAKLAEAMRGDDV